MTLLQVKEQTQETRNRQEALKREMSVLEQDFSLFAQAAWPVLEPGRPLAWSWHYDLMAEYLTLVRDGTLRDYFPDAKGIIFNVPPRTAKSTLITICFAVWCWLTQPSRRFMCASYAASLALAHSIRRRDLIRSEWFQERWADRFQLKLDVNRQEQFDNSCTGQMIATSVGGSVTGKGGDDLIVDDPLDPGQAASDAERAKANHWMGNTLRSRFNDPSGGVCILVMQRLHELDTTGFVLQQEPKRWIQVKVPLEAENLERYKFPVSGRVHVREPGDVLQPSRFPPREVTSLKVQRLAWAGQYQQRPAPLEGNMIKRSDVRYYDGYDEDTGEKDVELPTKFDWVLISADCAFKDLKTSDYVAIGAIGVVGGRRYLLNVVNAQLDLPATEAEILRQRDRYKASHVLVEDKANGSGSLSRFKAKLVASLLSIQRAPRCRGCLRRRARGSPTAGI